MPEWLMNENLLGGAHSLDRLPPILCYVSQQRWPFFCGNCH